MCSGWTVCSLRHYETPHVRYFSLWHYSWYALPVKQFAFPSAVFLMRTKQPRPKKSASMPRQSSAGIHFPDGKLHTSVQRAVYVQLGGTCTASTSVKVISLYSMERKKGIKINVLWHSESGPNQVVFKLIHMGFGRADSSSSSSLMQVRRLLESLSTVGILSFAHSLWHQCL